MPAPAQHRRAAYVCIAITALLALAPMLLQGLSCGNDLTFHMQSWMETANHWREGIFYPRWAATSAWGAGEPRFIFYPPLSWLLGAALGTVAGWKAAPFLFVFAALAVAGYNMWRFATQWLPPRAAALAACLYIANPYTLFVIYTRAAMAELLAAAVLPWLFAEALRPKLRLRALALAVAAVWLANAPAAVMASYTLAVLLALRTARERRWHTALTGAAAVALGLLLASFYILPAAYEKRWVQITQVLSGAYDFHANFLFGGMGDPLHDLLLNHVSRIAVLLLSITFVAAAFSLRRRHLRAVLIPTLAIAAIILFLLLPPSGTIWAHLPQLRFLQFPWRWLAVLAPLFAFATAAALSPGPHTSTQPPQEPEPHPPATRGTRRSVLPVAITAALCITSVALCYSTLRQSCDPEDTPAGIRTQYLSGNGFEGTDEYVPRNADPDDLRPNPEHPGYPRVWLYRDDTPDGTAGKPESEDQSDDSPSNAPEDHVRMASPINITRWDAEHKTFTVHASRAAIAILQLEDYPAWSVTVDGHPAGRAPAATSGQMQVPLLDGDHTVDITFRHTPDRVIADLLSSLGIILLAWLWRSDWHRNSPAARSSAPHANSGIIRADAG